MTAGLFAQHGCWTGRCKPGDERNARGYYENLDVKEDLLRRWGRAKREGYFPRPTPDEQADFRDRIEHICRKAGERRPCIKHGALYWRAWGAFDDPTYVCVYRPPEAILASASDGIYMTDEAVALTHGAMEWCIQHAGGIRVDAERLIAGDYAQIERAFHEADLGFDPRVADRWIDSDLWHHGDAA